MGVINAENTLSFKSSQPLFDRIKKRLTSFDEAALIDDGDFHKDVNHVLGELGLAVMKECEAVIKIKDFKAKLPANFSNFHFAARCSFDWKGSKSISEQKPYIFYQTEISNECPAKCEINCVKKDTTTKIVVRTFIDDTPCTFTSNNDACPLILSSNVKSHCLNMHSPFKPGPDEITIEDKVIYTMFDEDSVYIQYYGSPMDEYGLPMIPDQVNIEKAIEYYIYSQYFETMYWNGTIPNIAQMLTDARNQYDNKYLPAARYWAKLPTFARMIQSARRQRNKNRFFNFAFDRTIIK